MESEFKNKLEEFIQSENFTEKICELLERKGNKIEDGIVSMLKEFSGLTIFIQRIKTLVSVKRVYYYCA